MMLPKALPVALPALLLAACVSATAEPYVAEVTDVGVYQADLKVCTGYAEAYHRGLSVASIGEGAVKGAASNASGAAVNPYVPVLGAAGGATTELLNALDLLNTKQRSVFLTCLSKKTERDRSALVLETE